jgi:hypothetical protein
MAQSFFMKYQIAIIITIIAAILLGMGLYYSYRASLTPTITTTTGIQLSSRFPPWVSSCPDYWTQNADGSCMKKFNNGKESCDASSITSNLQANYSPINPNAKLQNLSWVNKCKWSRLCNVQWEGVSDKACVPDSFAYYDLKN